MKTNLDKSALFDAQEAYWNAEGGTDKGIEAAIAAYLERVKFRPSRFSDAPRTFAQAGE